MNPDQLDRLLSEAAEYGVCEDDARLACPWAFPEPEAEPEPPRPVLFEDQLHAWNEISAPVDMDRRSRRL